MSTYPELLSTKDAARVLGILPDTLLQYARAGRIKGSFFCKKWRFRQEDIDAFVKAHARAK